MVETLPELCPICRPWFPDPMNVVVTFGCAMSNAEYYCAVGRLDAEATAARSSGQADRRLRPAARVYYLVMGDFAKGLSPALRLAMLGA